MIDFFKSQQESIDIVVDTDAFADSIYEMDDQFAIAYMLTFPKFNVKAFYTFQGDEGFTKGIEEVVKRCGREDLANVIFSGGNKLLDVNKPEKNCAVQDLIERSKDYSEENPLYVLAIGPLTNIGLALLIDPTISKRIVVVALMGHDFKQADTAEYNLIKDLAASQVLVDSDTPLVLVPCIDVAKKLVMSSEECIEHWQNKNSIGDYLIYCMSRMCPEQDFKKLKRIIWDAVPVVFFTHPEWLTTQLHERPTISSDKHWVFKKIEQKLLYVSDIEADKIKTDILERIENCYEQY